MNKLVKFLLLITVLFAGLFFVNSNSATARAKEIQIRISYDSVELAYYVYLDGEQVGVFADFDDPTHEVDALGCAYLYYLENPLKNIYLDDLVITTDEAGITLHDAVYSGNITLQGNKGFVIDGESVTFNDIDIYTSESMTAIEVINSGYVEGSDLRLHIGYQTEDPEDPVRVNNSEFIIVNPDTTFNYYSGDINILGSGNKMITYGDVMAESLTVNIIGDGNTLFNVRGDYVYVYVYNCNISIDGDGNTVMLSDEEYIRREIEFDSTSITNTAESTDNTAFNNCEESTLLLNWVTVETAYVLENYGQTEINGGQFIRLGIATSDHLIFNSGDLYIFEGYFNNDDGTAIVNEAFVEIYDDIYISAKTSAIYCINDSETYFYGGIIEMTGDDAVAVYVEKGFFGAEGGSIYSGFECINIGCDGEVNLWGYCTVESDGADCSVINVWGNLNLFEDASVIASGGGTGISVNDSGELWIYSNSSETVDAYGGADSLCIYNEGWAEIDSGIFTTTNKGFLNNGYMNIGFDNGYELIIESESTTEGDYVIKNTSEMYFYKGVASASNEGIPCVINNYYMVIDNGQGEVDICAVSVGIDNANTEESDASLEMFGGTVNVIGANSVSLLNKGVAEIIGGEIINSGEFGICIKNLNDPETPGIVFISGYEDARIECKGDELYDTVSYTIVNEAEYISPEPGSGGFGEGFVWITEGYINNESVNGTVIWNKEQAYTLVAGGIVNGVNYAIKNFGILNVRDGVVQAGRCAIENSDETYVFDNTAAVKIIGEQNNAVTILNLAGLTSLSGGTITNEGTGTDRRTIVNYDDAITRLSETVAVAITNNDLDNSSYCVLNKGGGSFEMSGGNLTASGRYTPVIINEKTGEESGEVFISGGLTAGDCFLLYNSATVQIEGGNFTCDTAGQNAITNQGSMTVSGGIFTAVKSCISNTGDLNITGGNFSGINNAINTSGSSSLTIESGAFSTSGDGSTIIISEQSDSEISNISGGTYSSTGSGYKVIENKGQGKVNLTGDIDVSETDSQADTVIYNDTGEVFIQCKIKAKDATLVVNISGDIIIDALFDTLECTGAGNIVNNSSYIEILSGNFYAVSDAVINSGIANVENAIIQSFGAAAISNSGDLFIDGAPTISSESAITINNTGTGNINIGTGGLPFNNIIIVNSNVNGKVIDSSSTGKITLSSVNMSAYSAVIYMTEGELEMNGGKITGMGVNGKGIYSAGGIITISGGEIEASGLGDSTAIYMASGILNLTGATLSSRGETADSYVIYAEGNTAVSLIEDESIALSGNRPVYINSSSKAIIEGLTILTGYYAVKCVGTGGIALEDCLFDMTENTVEAYAVFCSGDTTIINCGIYSDKGGVYSEGELLLSEAIIDAQEAGIRLQGEASLSMLCSEISSALCGIYADTTGNIVICGDFKVPMRSSIAVSGYASDLEDIQAGIGGRGILNLNDNAVEIIYSEINVEVTAEDCEGAAIDMRAGILYITDSSLINADIAVNGKASAIYLKGTSAMQMSDGTIIDDGTVICSDDIGIIAADSSSFDIISGSINSEGSCFVLDTDTIEGCQIGEGQFTATGLTSGCIEVINGAISIWDGSFTNNSLKETITINDGLIFIAANAEIRNEGSENIIMITDRADEELISIFGIVICKSLAADKICVSGVYDGDTNTYKMNGANITYCTVEAIINDGYSFVNWIDEYSEEISSELSLMIGDNTFLKIVYLIIVSFAPAPEASAITYGDTLAITELSDWKVLDNINSDEISGTLAFVLSDNTVLSSGVHELTLQFTPDNEIYCEITCNIYLTVNRRPITVRANSFSKTYGDADPAGFSYFLASGSLVDSDELNGSLLREPGESNGDYSIYTTNLNNANNPDYDITFEEGIFTIDKRPLILKINNDTKIYGDSDPNPAYEISGYLTGDEPITPDTPVITRIQGESVGDYLFLTESEPSNADYRYELSLESGALTITSRPLTVTVESKQKTYGDPDPQLTVTLQESEPGAGWVEGDIFEPSTISREEGEAVRTYQINCDYVNDNYDITVIKGVFTVTVKELTISALHGGKVYGDEDPVLGYSVEGLAFNETQAVIGSVTVIRTAGESAGPYTVTVSSEELSNNYIYYYNEAVFTISKKAVTVIINNAAKVYGDNDPVNFTYTVSGLVGNDTFSGAVTRTTGENAGSYEISGDLLNDNYSVSIQTGYFTITKRPLNVVADNKSKYFGAADPALTYTHGALVGNDTISGNLSRAAGENAGKYAINIGTVSAGDNYEISFTAGEFTIMNNIGCDIAWLKVNDIEATVDGLNITATVNAVVSADITLESSSYSAYKVYSDASCANEISLDGIDLDTGENTVYIKVTAQDETAYLIYTLTITRTPSGNCILSPKNDSLTVNGNNFIITDFEGDTLNFGSMFNVPDYATCKIYTDPEYKNEFTGDELILEKGRNIYYIRVIAEDNTVSEYVLEVKTPSNSWVFILLGSLLGLAAIAYLALMLKKKLKK
ncbi:MAG: MBG domain-containing protein [Christensenellales bacterium]